VPVTGGQPAPRPLEAQMIDSSRGKKMTLPRSNHRAREDRAKSGRAGCFVFWGIMFIPFKVAAADKDTRFAWETMTPPWQKVSRYNDVGDEGFHHGSAFAINNCDCKASRVDSVFHNF